MQHHEVTALFTYINGKLYWKTKPNKYFTDNKLGTIVGESLVKGYNRIRINKKMYYVHRLIWLFFNKDCPKFIDHINGNRNDNRIENLRGATIRENGQNRIEHRKGKLVGAIYDKKHKKWHARITINSKRKHLGSYNTELEAHEAYVKALQNLADKKI